MKQKQNQVYIIAEAACEHRGRAKIAKEMIKQAAAIGADCVKFQLYSQEYANSQGQLFDTLNKNRLLRHEVEQLKLDCEREGIDFLCSAFDFESMRQLKDMGCTTIKIPSPKNEDTDFIFEADKLFDRIILSQGMSNFILHKIPRDKIKYLQCTSAYPCPYNQVNLKTLKIYDGISDHTLGWEVPVAATALGAEIIEKHFTLDKMNGGPDSHMSLSPMEFMDMVHRIRNVEAAMGDGVKKIEESEKKLLWRKR